MNHKRGKPKSSRSGCLMCKPHKANCRKDMEENQTMQERRARIGDRELRDGTILRDYREDWNLEDGSVRVQFRVPIDLIHLTFTVGPDVFQP